MKLIRYKGLVNHGFMPLLNEACSWFDANGMGGDTPATHWQQNAIVIYDGEVPVAIMTYEYTEHNSAVFILISYVKPRYRRQGLYNALWEEIKKIAFEKGAETINSVTSPKNFVMQGIYANLGREVVAISYEYKLRPLQPSIEIVAKKDDDTDIPF